VKVNIQGLGRVKKQSVSPGTPLRKYQNIQLQLS
jgi:hypothetical protein